MTKIQLIVQGVIVAGVLAIWTALYCVAVPPTRAELNMALFHDMGLRR